jgi:hypothetical protein
MLAFGVRGARPRQLAWQDAMRSTSRSRIREGLAMSREPALLTSAGRMPERSQHRVSEGRMPERTSGDGAWAAPNRCQLVMGKRQLTG